MMIEIEKSIFVDPSEVIGIRPEVWTSGGISEGVRWRIYGSHVTVSFKSLPEVKLYGPSCDGCEKDGLLDEKALSREPSEWAEKKAREIFIKVYEWTSIELPAVRG